MITKEQALSADLFHLGNCIALIGPRGGITRTSVEFRRNGRTKTWVTRPDEWSIPVKTGFRACDYITHQTADQYHLASDCPLTAAVPPLARSRPLVIVFHPGGSTRDLISRVSWEGDSLKVWTIFSKAPHISTQLESEWLQEWLGDRVQFRNAQRAQL